MESLQFITAGTTIEGSVSFTGGAYEDLWGEDAAPDENLQVTMILNYRITGINIPDGSAEIELYAAGPIGDFPSTVTIKLNGRELDFGDIDL